MPEPSDVRAAVRGLVESAGLPVSDEEFESFVTMYPTLRAGADSLDIPEVRYEEPALIFTPVAPPPEAA